MLSIYLEDPKIERKVDLDILEFWKINEAKYGELSNLARDVLSVPLITVASESTFSIGGRILSKWKSSYLPKNVDVLITTRSWLYGFDCKYSMLSFAFVDIYLFPKVCESCVFCFILAHEEEEFIGSDVEWLSTKGLWFSPWRR